MVSGKSIQALAKNQPQLLPHACGPVLGCWALPASPLPSGNDRAPRSLLAVYNPFCSPGDAGQDMAIRMDLVACGPAWWYSGCPVCLTGQLPSPKTAGGAHDAGQLCGPCRSSESLNRQSSSPTAESCRAKVQACLRFSKVTALSQLPSSTAVWKSEG